MVIEENHQLKYNSTGIAQKDPLALSRFRSLDSYDMVDYYTGIVSCFEEKIMQATQGFNRLGYQSCGTFALAKYYFDGKSYPDAKAYSANKDSERFKKGDSVFVTSRKDLAEKIKALHNLMKELESSSYRDLETVPEFNTGDVYCNVVSDISGFTFVRPKGSAPFFVFDFYPPKERERIIRQFVK